jgi:hypothetical protein
VLPGWGQYYNGQHTKAWTVGLITLGLLGATTATYVVGDNARQQYLDLSGANADYDTPYNTWNTMSGLNNLFYVGTLIAYGYGIGDAIANAKGGSSRSAEMQIQSPLQLAATPGGFKFRLNIATF